MAAESLAEGGARFPYRGWVLVLATAALVTLGATPMVPELARAECAASLEEEANRASWEGRAPGEPGVVCDIADLLDSVGHHVGSLLGLSGQE